MAAISVIPNQAVGKALAWIDHVNGTDLFAAGPGDSAIVVVLFETMPSVAALRDADTLAAVVSAGAVESTFTNAARVYLDDTDIDGSTVNDTDDLGEWLLAAITPLIEAAGGDVDQDIDGIGLFVDPDSTGGADSEIVPWHYTLDDGAAALRTTNGSDLDLTSAEPTYSAQDSTVS